MAIIRSTGYHPACTWARCRDWLELVRCVYLAEPQLYIAYVGRIIGEVALDNSIERGRKASLDAAARKTEEGDMTMW
jgi:hypothetical protein